MADAAQAHADHQDHRQVQLCGQVGAVEVAAEGHAEAAHAFDHDRIRRGQDLGIGGDDRHRLDAHAFEAAAMCGAQARAACRAW
jgi:hypothetical protein